MVMGRPKKYRNCLDLDMDAEIYFESCIYDEDYKLLEMPIPFTITGLAIALNMDRDSVLNYAKDKDFFGTIKRHKLRVENDYEIALRKNGKAGEIFGLKNFGWKDKSEIVHGLDKETMDHSTRLADARKRKKKG